MIGFKTFGDGGVLPCFKTSGSAGADFCLPRFIDSVILEPAQPVLLGLRIALEVDHKRLLHYSSVGVLPYIKAVPRSSLRKRGISFLGEGIIDIDYTGEIHALLFNHTSERLFLLGGEAIGQFIPCVADTSLLQVERKAAIRGAGGFGSTGKGNE